jgi:hypothetical protein
LSSGRRRRRDGAMVSREGNRRKSRKLMMESEC